jgi:hypothetical protein
MIFMDVVLGLMAFLLCAVLLVWRRHWAGRGQKPPAELNRLSDVVKSAEIANEGFFRSLELVQKNLEALIARAESTEQRLRGLMLHPGVDRREQYTAAALLLAEGQDIERVAAMLNLPQTQVHLIRDLQQVTAREKRSSGRPRRSEEPVAAAETSRPLKTAAPQEKAAARPILLVDAIRNAANIPLTPEPSRSSFKGVTA